MIGFVLTFIGGLLTFGGGIVSKREAEKKQLERTEKIAIKQMDQISNMILQKVEKKTNKSEEGDK